MLNILFMLNKYIEFNQELSDWTFEYWTQATFISPRAFRLISTEERICDIVASPL